MLKILLFAAFPLLEIYLLATLGGYIDGLQVVLLVVASFIFGASVIRHQGQQSLYKVRSELGAGRVPEDLLLDNLLIYFAGVLLLLPGVLSDVVGLLLLIEPLRKLASAKLIAYLRKKSAKSSFSAGNGMFFYSSSSYNGTRAEPKVEEGVFECTPEEVDPKSKEIVFDCDPNETDGADKSGNTLK